MASQTKENEKLITIEDTLELHLDRIYPTRDIVAMKTNNIASYSDVLVTCMRQNPKWILLSEVRSAEAVMAVRNSISSGHYILSTIHADKAASIPNRMYSLLETNQDISQFLKSIYRYIQLGIYIRGYQDKETKRFVREIAEVTEFYVDENNEAIYNTIYKKSTTGHVIRNKPSKYLVAYLDAQGVILDPNEVKSAEELGEKTIDFDTFVKNTKEINAEAEKKEVAANNNATVETPVQPQVTKPNINVQPQTVQQNVNVQPQVAQQRVNVQPQAQTIQSVPVQPQTSANANVETLDFN